MTPKWIRARGYTAPWSFSLDRAGREIAETEDNQSAKDLQQRAYEHIRKAKEQVQQAIRVRSHS